MPGVKVYTYESISPLSEQDHPKARMVRLHHGQQDDHRWCCHPNDLEPIPGHDEREKIGHVLMLKHAQCRWCGQPHELYEWRDPVGESNWGYRPCDSLPHSITNSPAIETNSSPAPRELEWQGAPPLPMPAQQTQPASKPALPQCTQKPKKKPKKKFSPSDGAKCPYCRVGRVQHWSSMATDYAGWVCYSCGETWDY